MFFFIRLFWKVLLLLLLAGAAYYGWQWWQENDPLESSLAHALSAEHLPLTQFPVPSFQ